MKTTLITIGIIFLVGCGKDKDKTSDQTNAFNKSIERCNDFTGEKYCHCLNRKANKSCASIYDEVEYGNCVKPFLDTAYLNYCSINRRSGSR